MQNNNLAQLELPTVMGRQFEDIPDDLFIPPNALEICLEAFSGPLDLLLYLIRKENINIIVGTRLEPYRKHTKPISIEVPIAKNARTRDRGLNASFMWTIDNRITRFHAKGLKEVTKVPIEECTFLSKDVLNFWKHSQGYNPDTHDIRCHVCGDVLNMIHDTWHMDHIDPNGENTLENCSVAHSVCNQFKTTLRMEELIALSKKVINHHVSKNIS